MSICRTWHGKMVLSGFAAMILGLCCCSTSVAKQKMTFEPIRESLENHNAAPEWFRDAKFGIYFHWGVYSVPAFGSEWYPRNMYIKNRREYKHHVETYGNQAKMGYHDFVPIFKARKFDADEWAELFKKSGAKFAGPVGEHHDGFAMWDSKLTPWNAKNMGPKRDISGELEKAIRQRGMKFIMSFHHARNSLWQKNGQWTGHYQGVKTNFPSLLDNPKQAILYGYMSREKFLEMWKGKLIETIDKYQPDIMWFDSWLNEIPEKTRNEYLAYYFNKAEQRGQEVVVTVKQRDLPHSIAVEDYEKGRANQLTQFTWLTDDTLSRGSWCYTQGLRIKPTEEVLHVLIDIVSKNGQLLLNISPKADGTIPDNQKQVLLEIGKWLTVCGESIYNTRPWLTFGEGPTRLKKGGHFLGAVKYTAKDIRYTRSKDNKTLYAICLGWPEGSLQLESVKVDAAGPDASVQLLGYDKPLKCRINEAGQLVITIPKLAPSQRPCQFAYALKLHGFKLSLHENAAHAVDHAIKLTADKAVLEGEQINLETKGDRPNIGFWNNPNDRIHWLVTVKKTGTYLLRGEFASTEGSSPLIAEVAGQKVRASIRSTGSWTKTQMVDMGLVKFDQSGVYHLTLKSADVDKWNALNVWQLKLIPKSNH